MSAFKALNGGSPKVHDTSAESSAKPLASEEPRQDLGQTLERPSPERPASHKEGWRPESVDRQSYPTDHYHRDDVSHKRKRSTSPESRHQGTSSQNRTLDTEANGRRNESREAYEAPERTDKHYTEDPREKDSSWPTQTPSAADRNTYDSHQTPSTSPHAHNDDQGGDASRRVGGQGELSDYGNNSPDAEERSAVNYGSPYAGEHRSDSMLSHDPKKRKRNFSNRTKTGCLTCRKRKKKCDEQKPECINCIRGGFLCAGYPPQRGAGWPKPDAKPPAVPLESKDPSYIPPGAYGMPQHSGYGPQPLKRESVPHYRGQILRIDPPQGRPLTLTEEDRPTASTMSTLTTASTASPENKLSAVPYTPANAFPTPISANTQPPPFADRMNKEYQRVPPLHDLNRANEPETPHPGNPLPQISILHAPRTSSPNSHTSQPAPSSGTQTAAQLALSHTQFTQRRTQKEEMLTGRHFYPFDKELCLERERCAAACWRFNNLTAPPTNGISPDERARLFLEILQPRDPIRLSPSEASPVTNVGRVGRHVAVETPFTCDYGYNITIGHHVAVGRNCSINDVAEVKIGDNCVIGPNVSIYTSSLPTDPKKRQGGQGPQFGQRVNIEQDCWIAGNVVLLPGVNIGKGSTVGAGSVVTKDVPPFTVVAGNPCRVLRGIGL